VAGVMVSDLVGGTGQSKMTGTPSVVEITMLYSFGPRGTVECKTLNACEVEFPLGGN
jgi:hypothetical protein